MAAVKSFCRKLVVSDNPLAQGYQTSFVRIVTTTSLSPPRPDTPTLKATKTAPKLSQTLAVGVQVS